MNVRNVRTIFHRELRDQLRDRRTMFMIAVLPIMLYPLLGISFLQITQFLAEKPSKVLVVGTPDLRPFPALFVDDHFAPELFSTAKRAKLLEVKFSPASQDDQSSLTTSGQNADASRIPQTREEAQQAVRSGSCDVAICFPPDFADRLQAFHETIAVDKNEETEVASVPSPEIIFTTTNEKSQVAYHRVYAVLENWTNRVGEMNLRARGIRVDATRPFHLQGSDLAVSSGRKGIATWSKILPVMLLLWALTGAFYPAVDLCAGEKERGTLETLLSSPAERTDIVIGKLLTIIVFSAATAILNLLSIGLTSQMILARLPELGTPPWTSVVWLLLTLIPMAAFFSALCLALAAFARSTKEGQYYLMPLLIITMPLVILPMAPGVELDLAHSLIPVTGVVLLLRSLLEGSYVTAARFALPVLGVTFLGCFLAIRWAVDQFNEESVLFRETERLDLRLWFKRSFQDRKETPSVAAGVCGGFLILLVKFFLESNLSVSPDLGGFVQMALLSQLVVILLPTLAMTLLCARSIPKTLLLRFRGSTPWACVLAVILAFALHPFVVALQSVIVTLYPLPAEMSAISGLLADAPFGLLILLLAVTPAICEELAFRGFVLSGCRHTGHTHRAIVVSALFFGATHMILQQSLIAFMVGMVIGYIAVRTGSIFPCMLYHVVHNTLGLTDSYLPELVEYLKLPKFLIDVSEGTACAYQWPVILCGMVLAASIWQRFAAMPVEKTQEEAIVDAVRTADHRRRVLEWDEE